MGQADPLRPDDTIGASYLLNDVDPRYLVKPAQAVIDTARAGAGRIPLVPLGAVPPGPSLILQLRAVWGVVTSGWT